MANDGHVIGAAVERGKILSADGGRYAVESYSRNGVVTLPLDVLNAGDTFAEGDMVYFFAFCDGHGMILRKINTEM